jgi:hypothetical protein
MQRNSQKRDKKKSMGKDDIPLNFFGQKFLTWTSPEKFLMAFLNSPC